MKRKIPYLIISFSLIVSCTNRPDCSISDTYPVIYPDYSNITVPSNIAPTNFLIEDASQKYLTVFEAGDVEVKIKGKKVCIPIRKWRMLTANGDIKITVYEKTNGNWISFKPFNINIAQEIDPYVTYRLIPPSFQSFEKLSISQRNITNFTEKVVYSNTMAAAEPGKQCINCHSFKNWHSDNMQFHVRLLNGGTIIYSKGKLSKINLKTDSIISAGVYPSWHPTHNYIAYSTNLTYQLLHTNHTNRIEVFDENSDLILYDLDNNSVSIIENDSTELECFPSWTYDGKTLYFVSAHIGSPTQFMMNGGAAVQNQNIRYNLYSKQFDPDQRLWGEKQLIIRADSMNRSITLPRVSPDGKWLMFTMGNQGVFHIWHKDSELYLMNLNNGNYRCIDEINSPEVDSYHSWSSNSQWIVLSSRREDGMYTRLYITHMNEDGTFTKPFLLPQKDPEFSRKFLYSFNIPEFTVEPVKVSARMLSSFINSTEAQPVSFEQKRGE